MDNDKQSTAETTWSPSVAKAAMAGLLGGLIGLGIIQTFDPFFAYADLPEMGLSPTGEQLKKFTNAQQEFYSLNYAAGLAAVGASFGVCFAGLTVPNRKIPSAMLAGLLGAVGAGIAGYFAGLQTGLELALSTDQSLTNAALVNFGIWGAMATGVAAGASLCQGNLAILVKSILTALIAAILVVVATILVSSIVFSGANSSNYIPNSWAERAVWLVVASATFGAAMAIGLKPAQAVSR